MVLYVVVSLPPIDRLSSYEKIMYISSFRNAGNGHVLEGKIGKIFQGGMAPGTP